MRLSYQDRVKHFKHPLAQKLLTLMITKQTNLAVAADCTRGEEVLRLAEQVGPEICVLKTHVDILDDFHLAWTKELQALAQKHQFLIFEDRKFADIGNTVQQQYAGGIYKIAAWADMVNAHSVAGASSVEGLAAVSRPEQACLLLAEMSCKGNLLQGDYVKATVAMAQQFPDFVIGFIAQHRLIETQDFLYLTPGVNLSATEDQLGQGYLTPEVVIGKHRCDVMIAGRGIYQHKNPQMAASEFRDRGWKAYEQALP